MKKIIRMLCMVALPLFAAEEVHDAVKVRVTGNRVSLRAAPDLQAVLMDRAMAGDELILKDNSDPEWVGVLPPETIDLWVNREFLDGSTVLPEILNIRSGPSLSHTVVGHAVQGDLLTIRGEITDWVRIQPTPGTTIWISRRYVEAPRADPAEPDSAPVVVQPEPDEPAERVAAALEEAVQPAIPMPAEEAAVPPAPVAEPVQRKIAMDGSFPQGIEQSYSGLLLPADGELYQLVDPHFTDVTVCYVRGNSAQMETFSGMKLELSGKTYRIQDKEHPVIVPAKIRLFPAP